MRHGWLLIVVMGLCVGPLRGEEPAGSGGPGWLWVYATCNFQVDGGTDELIELMSRARRAGYNGMLVNDYKFGKLEGRPGNYYRNLQRAKDAAAANHLQLIPAVMEIGYSNSLLQNDPNLAAGLPVRDCPMLVHQGKATAADGGNMLRAGDFEKHDGNRVSGLAFIDGPGQSTFVDTDVHHGGSASLRMMNFRAGNEAGNARVHQKLTVGPWRQYAVTCWIKTQDAEGAGDIRIAILGDGGRPLNFTNLNVKRTQDWTKHAITFNSLENTQVGLYVGIWSGKGGVIWLDDLSVEPVAGVNLLRRAGCPVRVSSEDGRTVYEEGRDYEPWADAKLGNEPWAGEYTAMHDQPAITLTRDSRIGEGEKLKVSYYHTAVIYDGQVSCSLLADGVFDLLDTQIASMAKYWAPRAYMMSHDEIRAGGFDALYGPGQTAGAALAENVKRCTAIIGRHAPDAEVFVWSDMFDPHHNAKADYYLVGSTLAESWTGLDRRVVIVNWNHEHRAESLRFFAGRGHRQLIAGYYDDADVAGNVKQWLSAAKAPAPGVTGVEGMMYTTWRNDYSKLEAFAEAVRAGWPR